MDSRTRALAEVASIPRDEGGPVFREPWEAQAFAMAVALHERGLFTWSEWAQALGAEIARSDPAGEPGNYYMHWLEALERLVVAHGAATPESLAARRDAWDRAAHATPHGEPILLCNDPLHGAG
jgi:nitrile hydratase accessory protein